MIYIHSKLCLCNVVDQHNNRTKIQSDTSSLSSFHDKAEGRRYVTEDATALTPNQVAECDDQCTIKKFVYAITSCNVIYQHNNRTKIRSDTSLPSFMTKPKVEPSSPRTSSEAMMPYFGGYVTSNLGAFVHPFEVCSSFSG